MGQQSGLQERLFYEFRLDYWVPVDHLLRKIDAALDFSSLRHELVTFYSHTRRPSIDPELMIRMLLPEAIRSIYHSLGVLPPVTQSRRSAECSTTPKRASTFGD